MKTTTKIIATTLTVMSLAAVSIVSAHPGGGYGMGDGTGMGPGMGMMGPGNGMGQGMGSGFGMGMGMGMGKGMMGPGNRAGQGMGSGMGFESPAVLTARLGDFKSALKITPAQEPAWQKYEAQLRQQVETRQAFHAAIQDPKATIDHDAQHATMTKLFAEQETARTELFAQLTPEQKALFAQPRGPGYGHQMWSQAPGK